MRCAFAASWMILVFTFPVQGGMIEAKSLIGTWQVSKGEDTTAEFSKDGTLRMSGRRKGKEATLKGAYVLEKDKLTFTLEDEEGKTLTRSVGIEKLTADALVIRDDRDKVVEFKRVK